MSTAKYIFTETQYAQELERLQAIEKIFDPTSRQRLESTGMTTNWRCLEVGAGAGSITQWMASAVGENGQVVAVDLDTRFVANLAASNVEVLEGNIQQLPLDKQSFDLVHARYVLIHNPDAHAVLSKVLELVKPGGWIVLEEPDFAAARAIAGEDATCQAVNNVNRAIEQMFTARGMDYSLGAKLPALIQAYDLQSFVVEVDTHLSQGGSGMATMMKMSTVQLAEKYLATGVVTQADIDHYGRFAEDPNTWAIYYATVSVVAQKQ
ncbi:class I SAM-dependent methyltransferase [Acaryochloris sp. CCMEE 5410]|uniref:class I SAM-dependent methyltransferase n=1 Tax=Acaryochloris sp. CCMEE 5410 TaxID=310037 RepID=UPI0002484927|nr:class I SAM-dependent methyltransferase [Acaryochloris sp. CCMEE 5410]KAI9134337.1 methyltransferase domain-containing protein [Acaryochloris sp. CCMEE 5410]